MAHVINGLTLMIMLLMTIPMMLMMMMMMMMMTITLQSQSIGLPPILNCGLRAAAAGAENYPG